MYWTPGWGNLATVGATLFVFAVTNAVASSRYRYDQEESRREVQRTPTAELVDALFSFIHAARNYTNQAALLEYVVTNNADPKAQRNEKVATIDEMQALHPLYDSTSRAARLTQLSVIDSEVQEKIGACAVRLSVVLTASVRYSKGLNLEDPAQDLKPAELRQHRLAVEESIAALNRAASAMLTTAMTNLKPQAPRSPWWSKMMLS